MVKSAQLCVNSKRSLEGRRKVNCLRLYNDPLAKSALQNTLENTQFLQTANFSLQE